MSRHAVAIPANGARNVTFRSKLARVVEGADFSYATELQEAMSLAIITDALAKSMRDGALRNAWNQIGAT